MAQIGASWSHSSWAVPAWASSTWETTAPISLSVATASEDLSAHALAETLVISSSAGSEDTSAVVASEGIAAISATSSEGYSAESVDVPIPSVDITITSSTETLSDYADTGAAPVWEFRPLGRPSRASAHISLSVESSSSDRSYSRLVAKSVPSVSFSASSSSESGSNAGYVVAEIIPSEDPESRAPTVYKQPRRQKPPQSLASEPATVLAQDVDVPAEAIVAPTAMHPVSLTLSVSSGGESGVQSAFTVAGHLPRSRPKALSQDIAWSPEAEDENDDLAVIAALYAMIMAAA